MTRPNDTIYGQMVAAVFAAEFVRSRDIMYTRLADENGNVDTTKVPWDPIILACASTVADFATHAWPMYEAAMNEEEGNSNGST